MFEFFSNLRGSRRSDSRPLGLACQLACESLEDRTTPTVSAITSNFTVGLRSQPAIFMSGFPPWQRSMASGRIP